MADYISMKQVPGGTVTAVDDRILYDYAINSGIIYGCEISYTGNNMIHINAGYGIIKGGLFEIEDHTEYVDYSESSTGTNGQIYLHFDAAAEDKLTIVKETTNSLHPMRQDADANYNNGVYEIQLCTFRATTTGLTNVKQTFVHATMPVDVLDSLEAIVANTASGKAAGALAVKELNSRNNYSTNEQLIGNWINGKPLYRRTLSAKNQTINSNTIIDSSFKSTNADSIINIVGSIKDSANEYYSIGGYAYADGITRAFASVSTDGIRLYVSKITIKDYSIIIEYTKP